MPVIDVHTHMLSEPWLADLKAHAGPKYDVKKTKAGQDSVFMGGAPFMTLFPEMFDYDLRIANMDKAGVDVAIVSLTCPSVYWGGADASTKAARNMNAHMAHQQSRFPDRIRFFASLPWQYADRAVEVLEEAVAQGAVGVFVSANVDGASLTAPQFAKIWQAIDDRKMPVLVHPTAPQGAAEMEMDEYGLVPPIGFMFDTTLAISRMIFDGFLDRYPNLSIIAGHGGGTLPYLAGRLDQCHAEIPACAEVIKDKPSTYLQRIFYDAVVYREDALRLCMEVAGGADRLMFGSDYPHNIGDMSGCLSRVEALGGSDAEQVKGRTALALFGL